MVIIYCVLFVFQVMVFLSSAVSAGLIEVSPDYIGSIVELAISLEKKCDSVNKANGNREQFVKSTVETLSNYGYNVVVLTGMFKLEGTVNAKQVTVCDTEYTILWADTQYQWVVQYFGDGGWENWALDGWNWQRFGQIVRWFVNAIDGSPYTVSPASDFPGWGYYHPGDIILYTDITTIGDDLYIPSSSSFAGVNHYFLASLDFSTRDNVIEAAINGGAKVIRTFLRHEAYTLEKGDAKNTWPDIENPMGTFVNPLSAFMDNYDDLLYSIYTKSAGQTKVILALHDANFIAGYTLPCDAYCSYLQSKGLDWANFYTDTTIRSAYKTRLSKILNEYKSKNFGGKPWSQLSEIILAIDLQNEPGVSKPSVVTGTGWICDIATYLKQTIGLEGIAVATGGIGGADSGDAPPALSGPNWPADVFQCGAIDIISLHGYYQQSGGANAGQPWCNLLSRTGVLVPQALKYGKLIMAEEWVYNGGSGTKIGDIQVQGHALNALGIPWTYWDIMQGSESCSSCSNAEVSIDNASGAFGALSSMMKEAFSTTTVFDWSPYFGYYSDATAITDGTCGANSDSCTWGCEGWTCSESSPCQGELECTNGVCHACTWGCKGWQCSANSPCKDVNECDNGICKACTWGCPGWACSASQPCQGELECTNGVCSACSWGCLGWSCSASSPCKSIHNCTNGRCI
ncbi:hypothetical protein V1525DRAFT_139772 [Lipomyces kononenkoae]|uniref:Uncharacterized protein n=1 Tax=Lipomyces kononenkoae TaxID=34357 RepID=A0ACC3TB02_LIPKO